MFSATALEGTLPQPQPQSSPEIPKLFVFQERCWHLPPAGKPSSGERSGSFPSCLPWPQTLKESFPWIPWGVFGNSRDDFAIWSSWPSVRRRSHKSRDHLFNSVSPLDLGGTQPTDMIYVVVKEYLYCSLVALVVSILELWFRISLQLLLNTGFALYSSSVSTSALRSL